MAFPVPPDARAARDFQLVLGQDEMLRQSMPITTTTDSFEIGEWVKLVNDGGVTKADKVVAADDLAAPAVGAKCCWTVYVDGDSSAGQGDAMATKTLDVLSGTYQAKTKLYDNSGALADNGSVGYLLVVVHDGTNDRGVLDAVDPASATAAQLAGVVGKVIEVSGGVLHFEATL